MIQARSEVAAVVACWNHVGLHLPLGYNFQRLITHSHPPIYYHIHPYTILSHHLHTIWKRSFKTTDISFLCQRFAFSFFASVVFLHEFEEEPELVLREDIEYGHMNRYI
jgi:hypothetical protein